MNTINELSTLMCSVAILLLLVIAILDLLAIPKELRRIADALEKLMEERDNYGKTDKAHGRG